MEKKVWNGKFDKDTLMEASAGVMGFKKEADGSGRPVEEAFDSGADKILMWSKKDRKLVWILESDWNGKIGTIKGTDRPMDEDGWNVSMSDLVPANVKWSEGVMYDLDEDEEAGYPMDVVQYRKKKADFVQKMMDGHYSKEIETINRQMADGYFKEGRESLLELLKSMSWEEAIIHQITNHEATEITAEMLHEIRGNILHLTGMNVRMSDGPYIHWCVRNMGKTGKEFKSEAGQPDYAVSKAKAELADLERMEKESPEIVTLDRYLHMAEILHVAGMYEEEAQLLDKARSKLDLKDPEYGKKLDYIKRQEGWNRRAMKTHVTKNTEACKKEDESESGQRTATSIEDIKAWFISRGYKINETTKGKDRHGGYYVVWTDTNIKPEDHHELKMWTNYSTSIGGPNARNTRGVGHIFYISDGMEKSERHNKES